MLARTAGLPLAWLDRLAINWTQADHALQIAERDRSHASAALQRAFDSFFAPDAVFLSDPVRTSIYKARQVFFQQQKLPPEKTLAAWQEQVAHYPTLSNLLQAVAANRSAEQSLVTATKDYQALYDKALAQAWHSLQDLCGEEDFQRALLFSSHALLAQLPRFRQEDPADFRKKERQTALAVLQYATRMAAKTSPYSRFTTVSLHTLEQGEAPEMPGFGKTAGTPNVALLEALYDVLLRAPAFYRALSVSLNPCIVRTEKEEYAWLYFDGTRESFQQAPVSPALDFVVETLLAKERALPFIQLLPLLADAADAEPAALEHYLIDLVDSGFLEWVLPETGLSAGWCGSLYQFLGFLPAEPLIVETAALLQWLRTAARMLSFQSIEAARATQVETVEQVRAFFEKFGGTVPPIAPEQVFFEDVEKPHALSVPPEALLELADQLADCWRNRPQQSLPRAQAALLQHWEKTWRPHEEVGFLEFVRSRLSAPATTDASLSEAEVSQENYRKVNEPIRIGALLQCYPDASGRWHAVVNALFPGGGKLMARWLHLFPSALREQLAGWSGAPPFPWQGWHNANFQSMPTGQALLVPGGRFYTPKHGQAYWLGNLNLVKKESGILGLKDRESGAEFSMTDLGLEAPETRPPAMQMLWQIGVPAVSVEMLSAQNAWQPFYESGRHRERQEKGSLTLAREAWEIVPETWQWWLEQASGHLEFFRKTRQALSALGIPRRYFAHFSREKPQYFDQDSPAQMLLFEKLLATGKGPLYLTEKLPGNKGEYATEIVLEILI